MASAPQAAFSPAFPGFIGQNGIVQRIRALYDLCEGHHSTPEPALFIGPTGCGKRTLAHALARHYGRHVAELDCARLRIIGDLTAVLTNLKARELVLLHDVNQLPSPMLKILVEVMERGKLTVRIGEGPSAREHTLDLQPFSLVLCCQAVTQTPSLVRSKTALSVIFSSYSTAELVAIASSIAKNYGLVLGLSALEVVVESCSVPGEIDTRLRRISKIKTGVLSEEDVRNFLAALGSIGRLSGTSTVQALSGLEFESLVAALLSRIGLRSEVTKASGDGGVDVVAHLDHPVAGGKFLVQCKRFAPENLVGASTLRDFYGALTSDRKALKGIFITTSDFTLQARQFAEGLPLQLINGTELRALMQQFGI